MKKISLLTVILFAIFAFVAISSSVASAQTSQGWVCPVGYTCTPISVPTVPVVCPTGYVCTPTVVNNRDSLIISPKGGEMYNIGDQVLIKWYEKNVRDTENYNIILEDSKTKIRKIIADSVRVGSSGIDGTSSFLWKIPQVESSGNYQIEIYRPEGRESAMRSGQFSIRSSYTTSPSPSPAVLSCSPIMTNLKIGDISNDVSLLHNFLIAKGYSFPSIDSGASPKDYFGLETLNAVMKYQRSVGVSDTGFVGPLTRGVINASCNNNSSSVNNQSVIKVINPSSGIVDSNGQFKVQWTGYSGNFDYYQIILGNSIANVEVSLDENTKISKYQNNYNSFAVWYFVKQITDKSGLVADKIKDAYYIKVNAIKTDAAGGGIVSTGKSPLFSIGSIVNTPATPTISINSPKQGETWSVGENKTISWNYNNFDSEIYGNKYVDVLLVPSDGREPVKLGTNISAPYNSIPVKIYEKTSDGRSAWLPGNYKIRVVCQATNASRFNSCSSESGSFKVISPSPSPSATVGATVR